MSYSIAWQRRGCIITYTDRVTCNEFVGVILAIHADEGYQTIDYVIHDMTGAADLDFSDLDMTKLVAHELGARFTNPNVRPAVVSTNPMMGVMTKAFSEITQLEIGFFATFQDALAWVKRTQ
jgi:hypothetical protein